MCLEGLLDLLRIHLLATGVDALRAPAEDGDHALLVDRRHVAEQHPAFTVLDEERLGGPGRVVVVAERHVTALRDPADPAGATGSRVAGSTTRVREFIRMRKPRPGPESSVAVPLKPDSEEPKLFSSTVFGTSSRNCCRTVSDMIAPEEDTLNSDEQSVPFIGPPSASIRGRSIASPTSETLVTFSFSIVRSTSSATNLRCSTMR